MDSIHRSRRSGRGAEEGDQHFDDFAFLARLRVMSPADLMSLVNHQSLEIYQLEMRVLSHTSKNYIGTHVRTSTRFRGFKL